MANTISLTEKKHVEAVSFRKLEPGIPSTTYASHGMYYYPARFIPQVVSWFIKNYSKEGDWIIDPFAGIGTLCIECLINNRNSICLDLNPVIEPLLLAKTYRTIDYYEICKSEANILNGSKPFHPRWSRIPYWYPPQIMEFLEPMWGAYYEAPNPLALLALFKTSRRFSYADDLVPKIFRSKRKIKEIEEILKKDYQKMIKEYFKNSLKRIYNSSLKFTGYYRGGEHIVKGGIDLPNYEFDRDVDHLITSPPYGRAHEYIRSFKLELAWLGYTDEQITGLINKEIPYRKDAPNIVISSPTYEEFRDKVAPRFVRDYEVYFRSVIAGLENITKRVRGYVGIFVGNATYGGVEPPYHRIFTEHFESKGFIHEKTLIDKVLSRKLFKGRRNLSPNGIEFEYLIVFKAP
ncbi:hypothetical protein KAV79_09890 [Candidatus Aerophobetes bacterium]|nr:hypothetical protein [Candidatus Aerophobetes bacterium]